MYTYTYVYVTYIYMYVRVCVCVVYIHTCTCVWMRSRDLNVRACVRVIRGRGGRGPAELRGAGVAQIPYNQPSLSAFLSTANYCSYRWRKVGNYRG